MLSVPLSEEDAQGFMGDGLSIAAINGLSLLCRVGGDGRDRSTWKESSPPRVSSQLVSTFPLPPILRLSSLF